MAQARLRRDAGPRSRTRTREELPWLAALLTVALVMSYAALVSKIVIDRPMLYIDNPWGRRTLRTGDVTAVEPGPFGVQLLTSDGRRHVALAVQGQSVAPGGCQRWVDVAASVTGQEPETEPPVQLAQLAGARPSSRSTARCSCWTCRAATRGRSSATPARMRRKRSATSWPFWTRMPILEPARSWWHEASAGRGPNCAWATARCCVDAGWRRGPADPAAARPRTVGRSGWP